MASSAILQNSALVVGGGILVVLLYHVVSYLQDPYGYNSKQSAEAAEPIPGPWLAKFSDVWLARRAAQGDRSGDVHKAHAEYGKVVRLAPNHVSIADPGALQIVYAVGTLRSSSSGLFLFQSVTNDDDAVLISRGLTSCCYALNSWHERLQHGNGSLKSDFYDAFVSIHRGLFNTRDRAEHTRKRKIVSAIFSQKNVLEFEPYLRSAIALLLRRWDDKYDQVVVHKQGDSSGEFVERDGRMYFDCLHWYNYLAFDIIGDLAFGSPFGMLRAGMDSAPVLMPGDPPEKVQHLPAVEILNYRGTYSASLGVVPVWARPYVKLLPWYRKGNKAVQNLAGIAVAAVEKRLAEPSDRNDLLSKLQKGKDADGNPMGKPELTAEALTQLIAGSDTTSNSSCAITYYLSMNPRAQRKLHAELDEALGPWPELGSASSNPDDATHYEPAVAPYDAVKALPYLDACINEGLRLHSTSSIGLPRIVPPGGLMILGRHYPEGSILSVPSYTIHRDPEVWGEDVEEFRPERWFEEDKKEAMQNCFNPFSYGPRACVGKNLASMELQIIIASVFRRFQFVKLDSEVPLQTTEGFLRKPDSCVVGMKRRD